MLRTALMRHVVTKLLSLVLFHSFTCSSVPWMLDNVHSSFIKIPDKCHYKNSHVQS
jgi:hypothetical protein